MAKTCSVRTRNRFDQNGSPVVRRRKRQKTGNRGRGPTKSPCNRLSPAVIRRIKTLASPPIKLREKPKRGILSTRHLKRKRSRCEVYPCPETADLRPNKRVRFTGDTTIVNFQIGSPSVTHSSITTPRFLNHCRPSRSNSGIPTSKRSLLDTFDDDNSNPPASGCQRFQGGFQGGFAINRGFKPVNQQKRTMSGGLKTVAEAPTEQEDDSFPFQRISASQLESTDSNDSCSSLSTASPNFNNVHQMRRRPLSPPPNSAPNSIHSFSDDSSNSTASFKMFPSNARSLISISKRIVHAKLNNSDSLPAAQRTNSEEYNPALLLNNLIKTTAKNTRLQLERKGARFSTVEQLTNFVSNGHVGLETYASRQDLERVHTLPRGKLIENLSTYYFPASMTEHSLSDLVTLWRTMVEKDLERARMSAIKLLDKDITARGHDHNEFPSYTEKFDFLHRTIENEQRACDIEDRQLQHLEGIICSSEDNEIEKQLKIREKDAIVAKLAANSLSTQGEMEELLFRLELWNQVKKAAMLEKLGYGDLSEISDERLEEIFCEQRLHLGNLDEGMSPFELRVIKEEKIAQAVREDPSLKALRGWTYSFGSNCWDPKKLKEQAQYASAGQIISELRKTTMLDSDIRELEDGISTGSTTQPRLVKELVKQMLKEWIICLDTALDRELVREGFNRSEIDDKCCGVSIRQAATFKFTMLEDRYYELHG